MPARGGRLSAMNLFSLWPLFFSHGRRLALQAALLVASGAIWSGGALAQDASAPRVYEARVTRVSDGDTVWVQPLAGGRYRKLRLDGLDAPEICQSGGPASRDALARRVLKQSVTVTERQRDDYGRGLAQLQHAGEDVGGWMVGSGHAWSYRWRRSLGPYQAQETLARATRMGLFSQADAEEPRSFRRRHGPCSD